MGSRGNALSKGGSSNAASAESDLGSRNSASLEGAGEGGLSDGSCQAVTAREFMLMRRKL